MSSPEGDDPLLHGIRLRASRRQRGAQEGEPSLGGRLAQIGVLGWIIVVPMLIGTFTGRWLDSRYATGVFWTAPLLLAGLVLGCWSAWKWMHSA